MSSEKPVIGIPACRKHIEPHMFHAVGEKYIAAVAAAAGGLPLLIPALGGGLAIGRLLQIVDGLMFTGSPSNVEPHHYQGPASDEGTLQEAAVKQAKEGLPASVFQTAWMKGTSLSPNEVQQLVEVE